MNVGRKLMLIVVVSVALVIIPAAAGIYLYLKQNLLATEVATLISETQTIVATNTQTLLGYEISLKALSSKLEKTLAESPKAGEAAAFDRLIQRDPDRAWRNRREDFDGETESGIFLPPDATLDNEQKSLHLRSKHLLDIYGTSITSTYGNIWLLTKDRTEVIYDHLYPEFAALMKAETDYTKTPWFTLGDPATNPKRVVGWTPPLLDPVSNSWMISAVLPLDVNGRWIGTIGRDISITKALPSLMQKSQRYSGEKSFLMDARGNFIDAGPWQKQLEANPAEFKLDFSKEPELAVLLKHKDLNLSAHLYDTHLTLNGNEYLAIDAPMPYLGWRYTRLVPIDEILAPMRQLFYSLMGIVLSICIFIGFLIDLSVQRNIVKRLQILANAARRYGLGDLTARSNLLGNDELANTSYEFDTMVKRVETTERELKFVMDNIPGAVSRVDNNLRYIFVSSQYPIFFGKPVIEIVGNTMLDLLGEELFKQEEPYAKLALSGQKVSFEISKDVQGVGEMFGLVHFVPNFDEHNNVDGFFISVVDITERKRIQESLLARDNRWKYTIEGFGDCLWDVDEIAQTITFSKAWYEIIGFSKDEIGNKLETWESRIHPDDKVAVLAAVQRCHERITPTYIVEYRTLCKDGSYKWVLDRGIMMEWGIANKPLRMVGTSSDITDRKYLENIREEAQNRLQKIASRLSGVIYEFRLRPDGSSCFPYASEAIKEIYRVSPEEVQMDASKVFAIFHPDDYDRIVETIQESAKNLTPWNIEFRVKYDDGTERWLYGNALPEREDIGSTLWHGYILDITEHKRIEQDLINSEFRWKFAIEGSGDGVWDWDIQSNTIEHSPRWKEILGYAQTDQIPNSGEWQNRLHPEDRGLVEDALQSYFDGKSSIYRVECRLRCKDGSYKWILGRGVVVNRSEDGKPLRMIGTHTDISQRKQSEIELSIAAIAFDSQESIMITDANKIMIRVNQAFINTTGYTAEEAIGQSPRMLSSGRHDAAFYKAMWESVHSKGSWSGEVWNKRKNGEIYPEQLTISAVKDADGVVTYYVGSVIDITARKQIEKELIESEYRWKFAIEGAGDGVWDVNVQTNEAKYSKRWAEMLGYVEGDLLPSRDEWIIRIHPEDRDRVLGAGQDYMDGKTDLYVVEYRLKCKDESYKWMLSRGMVVSHSDDGKALRMIGTQSDINERKLAEVKLKNIQKELLESHERYVDLYEFAPLGYLSVTKHGMIAEVNWKVTAMLGLTRKEINDHRFEQFVAEDDKDFWRRQLAIMKTLTEGEDLVLDIKLVHDEGNTFNAKLHCLRMDVVDDQPIIRMTLEDITLLKKADEALHLRERYQRSLLDNFPFMVWLKDNRHRYLAVNHVFAEACGYDSEDQIPGKSDLEVLPKGLAKKHREDAATVIREGKSISSEELIEVNGKLVWYETYKSPVIVNNKIVGTVGFARDINDRKHTEEFEKFRSHILELLIKDMPLQSILENIVLGVEQSNPEMLCSILMLDTDGKHLVNSVAPSLPTYYNAAVDGLEVGMGVGSCGTAAYTGERIIVDDIATHSYWENFKELALNSGLRACWSQPIFASSGKMLGTFAIYHRYVHTPSEKDIRLIEQTTNLASIAIERKLFAENIRENEALFRSMIEAIPDAIFLKDGKSRWLVVNEQAKRLFQLHDIPWYGKTEMELAELHPEFRSAHEACLIDDEHTWKNGELTVFNEIAIDEVGQKHDFEVRKAPIYGEQGQRKALLIIGRDITERKLADNELSIAATAFESQEGMMVTDANNIILKVNKAFSTITGYSTEEAIGHSPRLLSASQHTEGFYEAMWECVHNTGHWAGEVYNRRKNGEVFPQHLTITVVKDAEGKVTNHVATLTDITLNKAAAEEIKHLAFYDSLTSLPNRRLMVDRLNQALVFSARTGRDGAVLFLDLDHFKTLNDSLGHDVGDLLLQQVAKRLTACVREGDTVARLGGDEYVVLLESLSDDVLEAATQVETIGEKILISLNQPYQLGQHEYHSTPSIGVALFSNHSQSQEELLKHADIAMYQAKKAGRNTIRFFDPKMQDVINTRVDLERELRKALEKHQLHLYYQIQVDITGRAMGAEALIRWLHPEHGLVSPFHFIPLAEDTGLILPIGQWVLETACIQLKAWEKDQLTSNLTLSINVSAKQFRQADFVKQVHDAVQRFMINPMRLKLELTESTLLDNIEDTVDTMNQLKEVGIRFSLDDFGTGYSSLQYLKRLPLYQLKIDQSFVRDIAVDSSDQAIVRTIIAMAHTLNLNVIAEGVETEEQQALLLNNGCTHYQGYFFGRPMPIEQFEVLLKES